MHKPGSFIDTVVLVYLASGDRAKADRAEEMLAGGGSISVQVLNELANVARRKMRLSWSELRSFLAVIRRLLALHALGPEKHEVGLDLAQRYGLSVYDAMIVAAALGAGCDVLWSEGMQHGLLVDGRVRIASPFQTI